MVPQARLKWCLWHYFRNDIIICHLFKKRQLGVYFQLPFQCCPLASFTINFHQCNPSMSNIWSRVLRVSSASAYSFVSVTSWNSDAPQLRDPCPKFARMVLASAAIPTWCNSIKKLGLISIDPWIVSTCCCTSSTATTGNPNAAVNCAGTDIEADIHK